MECIICRKEKDPSEMSDEHVIPDSLGGYYHIYNVCRPCNSAMGETIDAALVNHKLTELYRFVEQMQGKSGKVPNPFSGAITGSEDPEVKARAVADEDGILRFMLLPTVKTVEEDGEVKSIQISVDVEDEATLEQILRKKLARLDIDPSQVAVGQRVRQMMDGGFSTSWTIDTRNFKIGLLKIAYEFAVDSIDAFYDTDEAREISRVLREADFEAVEAFVKIGSGLQPEIFAPFADYLDLESKKHYLLLFPTDMGLVCCIKLHSLFCIGVVLSSHRLLPNHQAIFGINDVAGRSFRKLDFAQLHNECLGPIYTRLGYDFASDAEAMSAFREINSPDYRNYSDSNGDVQLYSANGTPDPRSIADIVAGANGFDQRNGNWHVQLLQFDQREEVFVRSALSDTLYRVSAIEISREFLQKA